MDDLLLFMPSKKSHISLLEDLSKDLLKNYLEQNYSIWVTQYSYRKEEFVLNL